MLAVQRSSHEARAAPAPAAERHETPDPVLTQRKPGSLRSDRGGRRLARAMRRRGAMANGAYAVGALAEPTCVLLRPVSLAWYRAASAAASMSVSSWLSPVRAATPTEIVS